MRVEFYEHSDQVLIDCHLEHDLTLLLVVNKDEDGPTWDNVEVWGIKINGIEYREPKPYLEGERLHKGNFLSLLRAEWQAHGHV